jgi:hypothetical protein
VCLIQEVPGSNISQGTTYPDLQGEGISLRLGISTEMGTVESRLKTKRRMFYSLIQWCLKNAVFWDVVPCRSCVNRRFGGMYRLHLQGRKICERGTSDSRWLQLPEDGGDMFLRNVGSHKIYMVPHPRRRHSS